ncbi:MAG: 50S ribosomal protein L33 [Chloroflexi bacterium]|nr:50S ribosomal protein L33 [Chloroflexota bacterium]
MAKKKTDRLLIEMACSNCKNRNYWTEKNKRNDSGRLELKKFCPRCRGYHLHREAR